MNNQTRDPTRVCMQGASWQTTDKGAIVSCGPLVGRVEADGRGVQLLVATWQGQPSDAFGAMITGGPGPRPPVIEVEETYVRGCDFVARYTRSEEFPVAPQFYWRAAFEKELQAAQVEMILSVQTDLLDSNPEVTVSSVALESRLYYADAIDSGAFRELTPNASETEVNRELSRQHLFVFRNEMLGISYAQMVHPSDFVAARVVTGPEHPPLVESTLFPEFLEKGVIRRGRICGWFMPSENDLAAAVKLARRFVDEELPLTA